MIFSLPFSVIFCFIGGVSASFINQPKALQGVQLGDSVTLECYLPKKDFNSMLWYKQELGRMPQPVAKCYNRLKQVTYLDGFKDSRFNVTTDKDIFHLSISPTRNEDAATYFCGVIALNELRFGSGTLLIIEGLQLNHHQIHQDPAVDLLFPGDNVTLNCTVEFVELNCAGDHSVSWYKNASGESDPGIIFTHGNRSDQCKKSSETVSPTQSCIYKLPKNNLSLSDAGTYYCAVAACGEILYGNGTKLNIIGNVSYVLFLTSCIRNHNPFRHCIYYNGHHVFSIFLNVLLYIIVHYLRAVSSSEQTVNQLMNTFIKQ
uniref:Ig-like domain-containing protein n=1 Tax=Astyanax mexicanus TaxID=7994 RepID=A0A3B1K0C0_ASTMX